jgi:predicted Zn-dependent protease
MGVMQLLESRIDDAITSLEKASSDNARLPFVHSYLAAAYALKGQSQRARAELGEAQRLNNAYSSLERVAKSTWFDNPKIRALAEATYFPGLRQAGILEN